MSWAQSMMVIIDDHDDDAHYEDNTHDDDAHGPHDVPGEHGPRWNPQLGRFAKWSSGQLAYTVVSVTFQWTEVRSPKSCHLVVMITSTIAAKVANPAWL